MHAPLPFNCIMRARFSVRFETQPWNSVNEAFPALCLTGYIQYYQYLLCYEIIATTGTSNSFIMSRGQPRQSGAIPFYSCCLWISVDRGAVVTYGEVSINKLRLTSLIKMLLYCILY